MSISERQNQPRSLALLVAQRYLYSRAKRFRNTTGVAVLLTVILSPIASATDNELITNLVTIFAVLSLVVDKLVFTPKEIAARTEAATIQEAFDCFVLDLSWSLYKGIQHPTEHRVRQLNVRAAKKHTMLLEDWYHVGGAPDDPVLARLHCQRQNFEWDADLRKRWVAIVTVVFCLLVVILVVLAATAGFTVARVLAILASSIRFLAWGLDECLAQGSAIKRANEIYSAMFKPYGETAWSITDVRGIQDSLYEHRRSAPPIPDLFYWMNRERQEREAGGADT